MRMNLNLSLVRARQGWRWAAGLLLGLACVGRPVWAADSAGLGEPPRAPTWEEAQQLPRLGAVALGPTLTTVDTSLRENVRNFYNAVYPASQPIDTGWNGNHASCTPGTTAVAFREVVALRLNFYRALAGVSATTLFDDTNSAKCEAAALIMSANNNLNHFPPLNWACYSAVGAEAAGNSNLALGNAGPDAIDAYMDDSGSNNAMTGHRRWMLYPQTRLMGSGDIPEVGGFRSANSLWVLDGHYYDPRPATRESFVSWPPPGYVPSPLMFNRWSFHLAGADFSTASVTVSSNGVNVPVTIESRSPGTGENAIVWLLAGMSAANPSAWPKPASDVPYVVNVQGILKGGATTNYRYTVIVFDPSRAGADSVAPTPTGATAPAVGQENAYIFSGVPMATTYQWRRSLLVPFTSVAGAETGLADFSAKTTPGYSVPNSQVAAVGQYSYHLVQPLAEDQNLTYQRILRPRAGAELRFKSRLGWAMPGQVATVSVSADGGSTWQPIYQQAGTGGSGEADFQSRSVSLAGVVGRSVLFRFSYAFSGQSYYPQTDAGVGWHLDEISWTETEEVTSTVTADVASGRSFSFNPPALGTYGLEVRGLVAGAYPLAWSPMLAVNASTVLPPVVSFMGTPVVQGGNVVMLFQVSNYRDDLVFTLQRSASLGAWETEAGVTMETVLSGQFYRAVVPSRGQAQGFYRLTVH